MSRFTYTNGFPKLSNQNYSIVRKPRRIADYETQRRANAAVQQILMHMHLTTGFGMDDDGYDDDNDDNASDAGDVESLAPLDQLVLQNNRRKNDKNPWMISMQMNLKNRKYYTCTSIMEM